LSYDRIDPDFAARRSELEMAARCTCRISRLLSNGHPQDGTAFFISPTLLLTAGHIAAKKEQILAQAPGKLEAELADNVFSTTELGSDVFECRVVVTLYKGKGIPGSIDFCILKVKSKEYRAKSWLAIDTGVRVPEESRVDLIGYPGDYSKGYLTKLLDYPIGREENMQIDMIMPSQHLIVSHGKVIEENDHVVYKLSTTGGMSGGPVTYNKKAVGMHSQLHASLMALGIHSGGKGNGHNQCVPLCHPKVKELIEMELRNENKPTFKERIKNILPPMHRTASTGSRISTASGGSGAVEDPEIVESV